jgi:AbiU2
VSLVLSSKSGNGSIGKAGACRPSIYVSLTNEGFEMSDGEDGKLRIPEVFKILSDDVSELHYLRNTYQFLFTSEHFAKLFESTAPIFFSDLYMLLFDGITLSGSRLLDRARTFGRDNCSLEQLLCLIEATDEHNLLCSKLRNDLEDLRTKNPLKFFRNRRAAHRDLEFALEKLHEQSGVNVADLDRLMEGIDRIMNAVAEICGCNAETLFGCIKPAGAQQIVAKLQSR